LKRFYRSYNRILRHHHEIWIARTGISEMPFHMETAIGFKNVGVACALVMEKSLEAGANTPSNKANIVSFETKIVYTPRLVHAADVS
jgi:3,4-dihydroxy-2-butanone 4-phosphate synthase